MTLTVTAPTGGSPFTRTSYITTGCVVPNFFTHLTSEADAMWSGAGFTSKVKFQSSGGGGNPNAPNPPKVIQSQTGAVGGTFVPATATGPGRSWECNATVTVIYAP